MTVNTTSMAGEKCLVLTSMPDESRCHGCLPEQAAAPSIHHRNGRLCQVWPRFSWEPAKKKNATLFTYQPSSAPPLTCLLFSNRQSGVAALPPTHQPTNLFEDSEASKTFDSLRSLVNLPRGETWKLLAPSMPVPPATRSKLILQSRLPAHPGLEMLAFPVSQEHRVIRFTDMVSRLITPG